MQHSVKGAGLLLALGAAVMIWTQLSASPQVQNAPSSTGTNPVVADASSTPERTPDHLGTHLQESTLEAIDP